MTFSIMVGLYEPQKFKGYLFNYQDLGCRMLVKPFSALSGLGVEGVRFIGFFKSVMANISLLLQAHTRFIGLRPRVLGLGAGTTMDFETLQPLNS